MTDNNTSPDNGNSDGKFEEAAYEFTGSLEDFFTEGTDTAQEPTEAKATDTSGQEPVAAGTQNDAEKEPEAGQKGEEDTAPPADTDVTKETDDAVVPVQALKAERAKRQDLERQLRELQDKGDRPKVEDKTPKVVASDDAPDMYENPEAYREWLRENIRAEARQASFEDRVNVTQAALREKHADYDDAVLVFQDLARKNPALSEQLFTSPNPAEFAYKTANDYLETKRLSDPATRKELQDKMRAELKAEMAAEAEAAKASKSKDLTRQALETPDILNIGSGSTMAAVSSSGQVESYFPE